MIINAEGFFMTKFKFIDLFAGIGAFHIAMERLGGECVFASEIDKYAVETYKENFHINSMCDITKVDEKDIPKHDVLCAGFPCQAFSTAGHKKGFADTRGTLFFEIERILKYHKTKYIVLENVKHLLKHDNGRTYQVIRNKLIELGYVLTEQPIVLSPHYFGIPQNRERIFILGVHKSYCKKKKLVFDLPDKNNLPITSIYSILEKEGVAKKYSISSYEERVITAWDEFHNGIGKKVYGFPVWVDEFGKTYSTKDFPSWKQDYCRKIRALYKENKQFIDEWMKKYNVKKFKLRDRKFEWQAGADISSAWETSIQLRQSGIRFKKPDYFPTLVAMVQTPIVAKYKRRLTPREAARLQSFPETFKINKNEAKAYKQFGNSANIDIIYYLAKQLFEKY